MEQIILNRQESTTTTTTTTRRRKPNNKIVITLTCQLCAIKFSVPFRLRKRKFCSRKCHYEFRTHFYNCIGCGIEFKPKFRHNPKFCTRQCYIENRNLCNKITAKYDRYYYCDNCETWIPHTEVHESRRHSYGTSPVCPKLNCNKNPLKTRSLNSKFNHKRKNVKYIE